MRVRKRQFRALPEHPKLAGRKILGRHQPSYLPCQCVFWYTQRTTTHPAEFSGLDTMPFTPFCEGDTHATFSRHLESVQKEIRELPNDYVLRTSPTELETYFLGKTLIEPLTLETDRFESDPPRSVQVDVRYDRNRIFFPDDEGPYHVPGTELRIHVPYQGDKMLWRLQASRYGVSGYPEIDAGTETITFVCRFADDTANPEEIKKEIHRKLDRLRDAVQNLHHDVEAHNSTAPSRIKAELEAKRQKAFAATNAVSALGIPIRRRDEPATYIAPVQRRKLPIIRPTPSAEAYAPEPELEEAAYQHILQVIQSASLVMERDPKSFATLGEEAIRALMLLLLNGHYEGMATGETFNGEGKTDILIRVNNKNVFIAECKVWHGAKKFEEAIDQLLGYVTWRDCKCALIVFNRQKRLIERRPENARGHDWAQWMSESRCS